MKNILECSNEANCIEYELDKAWVMIEDLIGSFFGLEFETSKEKILEKYQEADLRFGILFDNIYEAREKSKFLIQLISNECDAQRTRGQHL